MKGKEFRGSAIASSSDRPALLISKSIPPEVRGPLTPDNVSPPIVRVARSVPPVNVLADGTIFGDVDPREMLFPIVPTLSATREMDVPTATAEDMPQDPTLPVVIVLTISAATTVGSAEVPSNSSGLAGGPPEAVRTIPSISTVPPGIIGDEVTTREAVAADAIVGRPSTITVTTAVVTAPPSTWEPKSRSEGLSQRMSVSDETNADIAVPF
jgi:hypothetical protein